MNNIDSASLVADRRNRENSAVYLNGGCAQIPSDSVSWIGDYSQTVWVNVQSTLKYSKLLDCGIQRTHEMVWTINWKIDTTYDDGHGIQIAEFDQPDAIFDSPSLTGIGWTHIGVIQAGTDVKMYRNGAVTASGFQKVPNVQFDYGTCFLGKSLYGDPNINAYVDDMWFFNRALSTPEVVTVMDYYY